VERSSLCNCVVNFLLEENYLLTAFELLHELLDDGRQDQAIRLQHYFADSSRFPPNQISRVNSLPAADPQTLLHLKNESEQKLAITDYELRLANEDIAKLKSQLHSHTQRLNQLYGSPSHSAFSSFSNLSHSLSLPFLPAAPQSNGDAWEAQNHEPKGNDMGPLTDTERRDLNCAVKEYLLFAGYRLTAMTFYEEVPLSPTLFILHFLIILSLQPIFHS